MQAKGMIPNSITMVYILKACSHMNDFSECLKLHAEIARKGFLEDSVHVATSLLDMYVKQGFLVKAQEIFDNVTVRNILSWTILIAGYADRGYGEKALYCFGRMQQEGFTPDTTVLACSLKGCGCLKAVDKGIEIHVEVERRSLLGQDSALANALLDMYVKCGLLAHAQEVLYELPHRDAASWTALIAGYAENGDSKEAFECFRLMQVDGINPNAVTLLCVLKACGNYGDLIRGLELHSEVERKGLKGDLTVANTLVDMYIKCGYPSKARDVFDSLPTCDVVSWNALISGYAELGHSEEVLACFEKMQAQDFAPDAVTYVGILKACASMGADISGRELHGEIARKGLTTCVLLGSALVDMYAKCGQLPKAEEVFETLSVQDVVSWNSLIAGYAQLGDSRRVFIVFDKMLLENVKPDMVTFLVVLTACNCRGLVKESGTYFAAMSKVFGIVPVLEHHSCMINLLGRNGNLNRVAAVIKEMPFCSNLVMWVTILNACKFLGNFSMAREAFQNALSLDDSHGAAYVLMSQVLANEN
ncbi:hypothetical protein KP509_19G049000 [Ceratopteris richardii]|nr:hypothetical protein KP509_19G049000 [Ceratopteris richardii]